MNRRIHSWANGTDPEEYGWVFDDTGANATAFVLSRAENREEAADAGVPDAVLDAYEASPYHSTERYGDGLTGFLPHHGDRVIEDALGD